MSISCSFVVTRNSVAAQERCNSSLDRKKAWETTNYINIWRSFFVYWLSVFLWTILNNSCQLLYCFQIELCCVLLFFCCDCAKRPYKMFKTPENFLMRGEAAIHSTRRALVVIGVTHWKNSNIFGFWPIYIFLRFIAGYSFICTEKRRWIGLPRPGNPMRCQWLWGLCGIPAREYRVRQMWKE